MFEKIEKELDNACSECKKKCEKYDCVVFRIKQIISSNTELTDIDIDDFFETENKKQLSIFDLEGYR